MTIPFTGGCECGAIRYEVTEAPLVMFNCHCRPCQKVTGGPYTPVVLVRRKAFRFTQGTPKYHLTDNIKGAKHKRGFCGDCGSRVTGADFEKKQAPWVGLTASSLDDPTIFKPAYDIFTSHAQAWDPMDPKLPKHSEYPPS
jgi:hypothetical protein